MDPSVRILTKSLKVVSLGLRKRDNWLTGERGRGWGIGQSYNGEKT
jgi:hypothetical protein